MCFNFCLFKHKEVKSNKIIVSLRIAAEFSAPLVIKMTE